jgi:membrane-bound ClpP family serine protease
MAAYPSTTWNYCVIVWLSGRAAIADPNIGFILLVLGALGLYVEFSSPGLIFPGVAGGILGLLGLSALSVLPINWSAPVELGGRVRVTAVKGLTLEVDPV